MQASRVTACVAYRLTVRTAVHRSSLGKYERMMVNSITTMSIITDCSQRGYHIVSAVKRVWPNCMMPR